MKINYLSHQEGRTEDVAIVSLPCSWWECRLAHQKTGSVFTRNGSVIPITDKYSTGTHSNVHQKVCLRMFTANPSTVNEKIISYIHPVEE